MATRTTTKTKAKASAQAQAIKDLYQGWVERMTANPEMDVATLRDMFESWHLLTAEPSGVSYDEVDAGGVPAIWCTPEGAAMDRVVIWAHGGGYVVGSMHSHRKATGHLAKAIGGRGLVFDYRRAPDFPHPAQNVDAVAVYRWVLDQGIAPERIATTGDSAGGSLCTSMVLAARDQGLPLPAAIMPTSPWYDKQGTGDSIATNAERDVLVKKDILMGMTALFLGESGSPTDPLADPLHADLAGLPPMLIQVGGDETLLDDSTRMAERARAAGVTVDIEVFPEMQHVFQMMAGNAPEADDAIAKMAAWVRPLLGLL